MPTTKYATQRDLSLAYSTGVAEPCLEIAKDVENVYKYTAKGNLVAVITRSEEHTSELQSRSDHECRLRLEKNNTP